MATRKAHKVTTHVRRNPTAKKSARRVVRRAHVVEAGSAESKLNLFLDLANAEMQERRDGARLIRRAKPRTAAEKKRRAKEAQWYTEEALWRESLAKMLESGCTATNSISGADAILAAYKKKFKRSF